MKINAMLLSALLVAGILTESIAANKADEPQKDQKVLVLQKPAFTPGLRLNGYTFYAFDDRVDSYYSNTEYFRGKIKGGFQWGGGFEYMMSPGQGIELSYLRLDTKAPLEYYNSGIMYTDFDVATNYIMLGGNRYFPLGGKVEPYAGLQAGVAVFNIENPSNGKSGNATKFAWGIKAGLNLWATDKVALKIQTGLLSAVQAVGGSFYFGTGGGGAGLSTYSTFYQFYIGGGLTFNLAK